MTIFRKSLITLGLVTFFLALLLIISALAFVNSFYYETNARGLGNTASALFSVFSEEQLREYFTEGEPSLTDIRPAGDAGRVFPFEGEEYRLTLIDKKGYVLWDSHIEDRMVNHLDREEVYAALEGREGRALRNSISAGIKTLYIALPVFAQDRTVAGVFRLSMEIPGFWQRITPAALPFLFFGIFLAAVAFGGILNFSRSLSLSLDRLVGIALETVDFSDENNFPYIEAGEAREVATLEKALLSMSQKHKLLLGEARTEGRQLAAILNSMSEAVIAVDNNLMLLLVNPCAKTLFNMKLLQNFSFAEAHLENENTFSGENNTRQISLLEATHSTELEWAARKVLETGEPLETELKIHSGGAERRFQVLVTPFPSENSGGVVMVAEDRTHIIRLEQIRRDFVANVSHELRTPIQLIKGFSETLLDSPLISAGENNSGDKEQLCHYIEIIHKNADTMENLIQDLLSLASLEDGGGGRSDKEEQELAPLFAEALSSVEIQAKKKQINIITDCPAELSGKVYGSYIIQALINLLDNAIKYSPENSRVEARAFRQENELALEVKDRGIGIPAEHHERIFERFYRVDKARSRDAGGTGLGLSIVRHIALLHGGRVEVESHAGEGSVFRLRLPD